MHWNARGSRQITVLFFAVIIIGCRSKNEHGEPAQTIVVRDAAGPMEQRGYDSGNPAPNRIEVVMTDPNGGGGAGLSPLGTLVGRSVKVQFRRDALGLTATPNAPIPLTSPGQGGRAVSISGAVQSASGGWLVLEREASTYWIPQAAVLLIETSDLPTTAPAMR